MLLQLRRNRNKLASEKDQRICYEEQDIKKHILKLRKKNYKFRKKVSIPVFEYNKKYIFGNKFIYVIGSYFSRKIFLVYVNPLSDN